MKKAKRQSSLENFFSKKVRQEAPQETADAEEQPLRTDDLRSPQIVDVNKPSEQLQPPGDRGNAMDIANFVLKSKQKLYVFISTYKRSDFEYFVKMFFS
ncbi:hypothetical protein JTE90_007679 [Oedothorax gibbosus]|uniref:Uncharacterized protein n=1 Tax=Oedothorax gibbosus TaxID=931172 RepID=A0AAV6ULB0_9ARAC|nr:hypothetical protein JTE90_007679 [Oedothorax gibbosus]